MTLDELLALLQRNPALRDAAIVAGTALASLLALFVARRFVVRGLEELLRRTEARWDDSLIQHGVIDKAAWLAPAVVVYASAHLFSTTGERAFLRLVWAYAIAVFLLVVGGAISAFNDVYARSPASKDVPIKGFLQSLKLLVYLIGTFVVIAVALGQSPWVFLSGVGAATAVLLLVFRDTLLSFVASIQLASNDMVRIGDWIEMPKYDANGEVLDIALHTVKVQNFDLTITTIPTFKLIEDSFKNYRSMQLAGARRIKRAVHVDQAAIAFLDDAAIARLSKVQLLAPYLRERQDEIARYNAEHGVDPSSPINGRRMTNVGTFRAYLEAYLRAHPAIRTELTFFVRQLEPTPLGLPIEIYVFTSAVDGPSYERVQADIFDHVLAAIPEFDLRLFQRPTGFDTRPQRTGAPGPEA